MRQLAFWARFRDLPFKRKLTILSVASSSIALILAGTALISLDMIAQKKAINRDLSTLSNVIGSNSTVALVFRDTKSAREILNGMGAKKEILSAALYDKAGKVFASYGLSPPEQMQTNKNVYHKTDVVSFSPITYEGERIGTIYFKYDLHDIGVRLKTDLAVIIMVLIISFLISLFFSYRLNRLTSEPILHLAGVARQVTLNQNYSLRATQFSGDELGNLIDDFNKMLGEIQRLDKQKEDRFHLLVDSVKDYAILMLDAEGRVISWNRGAERIKGYKAEEILNQHFSCFYLPEEIHQGKPERDLKIALAEDCLEKEGWQVRKDGSHFWANVVITPIRDETRKLLGFGKVTRDCTESRKAEAKFRDLLESAPDAMVIVNLNGQIVLINAQTERLFGYKRDELLGQMVEVLVPIKFRTDHPTLRNGYFHLPKPRHRMGTGTDFYGLRKDGTEFAAEISLNPIETLEGTLVTAAIRDITERKQLQEQMQKANRLKSEFLANMSHELRTPLNAIIGFTALIHKEKIGPISASQKEYLGDILTSARHLLQLINDILDLAKVESGKIEFHPEPINLANLISEVTDILRELAAEKRLRMETLIAPDLCTVTLDPAKLKQVLYNYCSNAIKFTLDGGKVMIRLSPEQGDMFRIDVEDTGIGIKSEDLDRLFVEFQQLDASTSKRYAGTGLGLAFTKRLVEAQGGKVAVKSMLGKGTTFSVILPRSMKQKEEPELNGTIDLKTFNSGPSILVIEDNAKDRDWIVQILNRAGFAVTAVGTGAEAISLCEQKSFVAVTLDLLLPDSNGWEILQKIRSTALNRDVPTIIVTVSADKGIGAGFHIHDFLVKPVQENTLLNSLERVQITPHVKNPILVIDDDPVSLKLIEMMLKDLGYRPICKKSCEAALEIINTDPPALIILDLLMPGMSGFEFLERFKRTPREANIPIIVWTVKDLTDRDRAWLRESTQTVVFKSQGDTNRLIEELLPYLKGVEQNELNKQKEDN